jgi:hypothetical protein
MTPATTSREESWFARQWRNPLTRWGTLASSLWMLILAVPFLIVGESWGAVWYYLAMPWSSSLKDLWETAGPAPYIAAASGLHGGTVFATIRFVPPMLQDLADAVFKEPPKDKGLKI